ncbi:DUF1176 domain-containing protein [Sphingomonas sp. ac-8]|uniref:DUF1176 domain-containing protein n=1 Tax=Sphingomonas sp. ac-8 TaxID=3242977 RepID=UPI003A812F52
MHRSPLLAPIVLLLAGCGGADAPTPAPSPDAAAAAASEPRAAVAAQPDADTGTRPQPTEIQTFRDWTVACDNGLACRAVALAPEDEIEPAMTLALDRAAGPDAAPTLRFAVYSRRPTPLTVAVDGTPLAKGGTAGDGGAVTFAGADATRIAAALGSGRKLTVADSTGAQLGHASLSGAAAALRWIDAQQHRDGTTGALFARGDKPDAATAPALPVIRAAPLGGEAALLDPARVATMKAKAHCQDNPAFDQPHTASLGNGTLALLPCQAGAYNLMLAAFVVRDGTHTPARFDAPSGMSEEGAAVQNVVDGSFENGVLTSFARGRGLGDCGIQQEFVWDGTRFRLSRQEEMRECRGSKVYLPTWRARVVR